MGMTEIRGIPVSTQLADIEAYRIGEIDQLIFPLQIPKAVSDTFNNAQSDNLRERFSHYLAHHEADNVLELSGAPGLDTPVLRLDQLLNSDYSRKQDLAMTSLFNTETSRLVNFVSNLISLSVNPNHIVMGSIEFAQDFSPHCLPFLPPDKQMIECLSSPSQQFETAVSGAQIFLTPQTALIFDSNPAHSDWQQPTYGYKPNWSTLMRQEQKDLVARFGGTYLAPCIVFERIANPSEQQPIIVALPEEKQRRYVGQVSVFAST